jgi:hypothetical protein
MAKSESYLAHQREPPDHQQYQTLHGQIRELPCPPTRAAGPSTIPDAPWPNPRAAVPTNASRRTINNSKPQEPPRTKTQDTRNTTSQKNKPTPSSTKTNPTANHNPAYTQLPSPRKQYKQPPIQPPIPAKQYTQLYPHRQYIQTSVTRNTRRPHTRQRGNRAKWRSDTIVIPHNHPAD